MHIAFQHNLRFWHYLIFSQQASPGEKGLHPRYLGQSFYSCVTNTIWRSPWQYTEIFKSNHKTHNISTKTFHVSNLQSLASGRRCHICQNWRCIKTQDALCIVLRNYHDIWLFIKKFCWFHSLPCAIKTYKKPRLCLWSGTFRFKMQ
jgi:hypothetical protein